MLRQYRTAAASFFSLFLLSAVLVYPPLAGAKSRSFNTATCQDADTAGTTPVWWNGNHGYVWEAQVSTAVQLVCPVMSDSYINLGSTTTTPTLEVCGVTGGQSSGSTKLYACREYWNVQSGDGGSCGTTTTETDSSVSVRPYCDNLDVSSFSGGGNQDSYYVHVDMLDKYALLLTYYAAGGS